jgi:hypothetical protein
MLYEDIAKVVSENTDKSFIAEMINGSVKTLELDVMRDKFFDYPVYFRTNDILPWFIARDIIKIVPESRYRW